MQTVENKKTMFVIQKNEDSESYDDSESFDNNTTTKATNTGRWTPKEHANFIVGILRYGNEWKKVEEVVKTRSSTQARSHAQKFYIKVKAAKLSIENCTTIKTFCEHIKLLSGKKREELLEELLQIPFDSEDVINENPVRMKRKLKQINKLKEKMKDPPVVHNPNIKTQSSSSVKEDKYSNSIPRFKTVIQKHHMSHPNNNTSNNTTSSGSVSKTNSMKIGNKNEGILMTNDIEANRQLHHQQQYQVFNDIENQANSMIYNPLIDNDKNIYNAHPLYMGDLNLFYNGFNCPNMNMNMNMNNIGKGLNYMDETAYGNNTLRYENSNGIGNCHDLPFRWENLMRNYLDQSLSMPPRDPFQYLRNVYYNNSLNINNSFNFS